MLLTPQAMWRHAKTTPWKPGCRWFFSIPNVLSNASKKQYSERRVLNFSQQEVYNVVANVTDYHRFVPFCVHSHVYSSDKIQQGENAVTVMKAELGVGFKLFEEKYMSKVTCEEPKLVRAVAADASLFKEMVTTWKFHPHKSVRSERPSCLVDFHISFEFASPLHAQASTVFFDQVSKMMLKAFVERCETVYNRKAKV
ncbi:uncharacterized protein BYT42DRAFT_397677 [Radiomyces spectabilis]|uniref:uncharacterized protein n=1 Tax=Radiomyces spectabilis TaxID=64574 RepID=UPI00221E6658|nr:uncharacterized protein BYT42DRAFT_397677 [Radiomyces spectabilis]KAI8374252.1 hypothetical protein BYT42DRAFT_397677 [Radiomyces spectabilis]